MKDHVVIITQSTYDGFMSLPWQENDATASCSSNNTNTAAVVIKVPTNIYNNYIMLC